MVDTSSGKLSIFLLLAGTEPKVPACSDFCTFSSAALYAAGCQDLKHLTKLLQQMHRMRQPTFHHNGVKETLGLFARSLHESSIQQSLVLLDLFLHKSHKLVLSQGVLSLSNATILLQLYHSMYGLHCRVETPQEDT